MKTVIQSVVDWLLEPDEPSIRFLTMRDLPGGDQSVTRLDQARREISLRGWVQRLLNDQKEKSYWERPTSCYIPRVTATVWHLQLLAVLGMDGSDPRIRKSCEKFFQMHTMPDGGYTCSASAHPGRRSEECITGRMAATLYEFGYAGDPRLEAAIDWLLEHQLSDGGWNCLSPCRHSSIYSSYMALWGLSKTLRESRRKEVTSAIKRGIQFMLAHRLFKSHRTGRIINENWTLFTFPPNVRYDVIHSLRLMGDLGFVDDEPLHDSLTLVESKMRREGYWLLDAVPRGDRRTKQTGSYTIELEKPGRRSKWVTLQALIVLSRAKRLTLPKSSR